MQKQSYKVGNFRARGTPLEMKLINYKVKYIILTISPKPLLGRMNASIRFMVWGVMPIGSLIGGIIGQLHGVVTAMVVGAIGNLFSALWIYFSPLRTLREMPSLPENVETDAAKTAGSQESDK